MHKESLDTKKLKDSFSESLITEISKTIKSLNFDAYFSSLDTYSNRVSKPFGFFDKTLFAPSICMLDYVLKNINKFKNLTFLDYGSGLGLFSLFLNQIVINCANFDDGRQLFNGHNDKASNAFFEIYKKNRPTSDSQTIIKEEPKVLALSGCWITCEDFFNIPFEFLMIDPLARKKCEAYGNCGFNRCIESNYTKIAFYPENLLDIYSIKKHV